MPNARNQVYFVLVYLLWMTLTSEKVQSDAQSISSIALHLQQTDLIETNTARKKITVAKVRKPVVGKSGSQKLKSVSRKKEMDLFVSRLLLRQM